MRFLRFNNKGKKVKLLSTLLAVFVAFQALSVPAFAVEASAGRTIQWGEEKLKDLQQRIESLASPDAQEAEDTALNLKNVKLDIGEELSLELIGKAGVIKDGVEWFCRTRIPEDKLYSAAGSEEALLCLSLSKEGRITAKRPGSLEVWAKWGDTLYCCGVTVRTEYETLVEKERKQADIRAEEIVKDMMHLKDVDKVLAAHDYLVSHVVYDMDYLLGGAEGALLNGRAVCAGYAQAFLKLMEKLNVNCRCVAGYAGQEEHLWNKVELEGEWYFLDVTWDDRDFIDYTYCLIDPETLGRDHKGWYTPIDEAYGTKYRYYPYEKQGMLARNKEELAAILSQQFDATTGAEAMIDVLIPTEMHRNEITDRLEKIAGRSADINKQRNWIVGDYTRYVYKVSNISPQPAKEVKLLCVEPGNGEGETTTKLRLKFDQEVEGLSASNIFLKDADKGVLEDKGNGTYELPIYNIRVGDKTQLPVEIRKRGFEITPASESFLVSVIREDKPQATFEAVGRFTGLLSNLEPGMEYTVGDGVWHKVNSEEPVLVEPVYQRPVSVIKRSSSPEKIDSEVQRIVLQWPDEPRWVRAEAGKLTNLRKQMEYQKEGDTYWSLCTEREITGLSAGVYYVRYKGYGTTLASEPQRVVILQSATNGSTAASGRPSRKENAATQPPVPVEPVQSEPVQPEPVQPVPPVPVPPEPVQPEPVQPVPPVPPVPAESVPVKPAMVEDKVISKDLEYKISSAEGKKLVLEKKGKQKANKVTIPAVINVNKADFAVTGLASGAFKGDKELKHIVIGANITVIGKECFKNCTQLKKLTFKGKEIKAIGKNAFQGIKNEVIVELPKNTTGAEQKKIEKILKNAGLKKFKIKK
ncbi:MAG: leucine-rich repeat protein [Acetivibrio ethanolgignens]